MDQSVLAGVGNVYRAEILFRHGVSPFRPGRDVDAGTWAAMWSDLVVLMRAGVRMGRIVTTRPEHRTRRGGAVRREDAHYVYRRTGLPCRVCRTPVQTQVMVGRNLYWCPVCQAV
jgi:endonuclease-8/formamidopyrimidine-DNA glycosylase